MTLTYGQIHHSIAILRMAKHLINRGWCQGASARDEDGEKLDYATHDNAVTWCATGALSKAADMLVKSVPPATHLVALTTVFEMTTAYLSEPEWRGEGGMFPSVIEYNDMKTTTKQDIHVLFNKAISALEGE